MNHKYIILLITGILILGLTHVFGQGKPYAGPDDPAGDIAAEREGFMTGNRVFLYFRNTTELSDWPRASVSKWPNNPQGVKMLDGIGLLCGAKVYIEDDLDPTTVDTIPLTTWPDVLFNNHHELYYLQTSYREEMDTDPTGTVEYGFYPVFGYFNETNEYPAMSNLSGSWPAGGWPATGATTKWPGEWDGRFGRGVIYADLETYFAVNDAQDQEYLGIEDKVRYYPRPGRFIQDDATIQPGAPWGGLGLRVQTRGFQWNNPQARDCIFWEYSIANISDYDLLEVAFGYWVDNAIGDDGSDELAYFNKQLDMSYSWDINGIGSGGLPTGTMGFAYLESPGIPYDSKDNDEDGLLDEKRDNDATTIVGPLGTIHNLQNFLDFYALEESDLRDHWDADEDQDWEDGEDLNGDGIYQLSEFAGDDVGLDGVGPGELNYTGPDEGECNHRPDFVEGVGCEPNFNATDVSESDMIGLTSFFLFPVPSHSVSNETRWFKNDRAMWDVVAADTLDEFIDNISNLIEVFASGVFPLYQGRVERISMSELHSYDALAGLNSDEHAAPALYELKKIVQIIYEKDYRFAQPPKMPTLTATAGDGQVILTWDDIADTRTRDPFVGNVNDFEGYKVYRSSDKYMSDPEVITDGYGVPVGLLPIYQCDLKDDISGFTNFGMINGMGYNLGSETGITHLFVDNTVQNGRTYYYAVVAYDYGAPDIGPGIAPSENNIVIELDEAENVRSIGKNVAIVTPHQRAAGYIEPEIVTEENDDLVGSGSVYPEILAVGSLQENHTYEVRFEIDTIKVMNNYENGLYYATSGYSILDITMDTVEVYSENEDKFTGDNLEFVEGDSLEGGQGYEDFWTLNRSDLVSSDIFDGMRVAIEPDVSLASYNTTESGWLTGDGLMRIVSSDLESKLLAWDYEIIFTSDDSAFVGQTSRGTVRDTDGNTVSTSALFRNQAFSFYVQNTVFDDTSTGQPELMDIMAYDVNDDGEFNLFDDEVLVGPITSNGRWGGTAFSIDFRLASDASFPDAGDVYVVKYDRPFWKDDVFRFTVEATDSIDLVDLSSTMDEIRVVPNPYIATNMMEPAVANKSLNQRRRLLFTNIPAQCTIKIFTSSGVMVDQIDVNNPPSNGIVHWDMLTREGLEIAAGMYLYHIEADLTGDTKLGKFAVIK